MTTTKLPGIEVVKHELDRMTKEGEHALEKSKLPVYQRYGELVRVRQGERLLVEPTPQSELLRFLSMSAEWFSWVEGKTPDQPDKEPVKPPHDVVQILFDQGKWRLPELLRVYDAPTLRPDGTVLQDPGYDAATKSIYEPRANYPRVKDAPTRQDAEIALDKIHWPVHEFPWKDGTDFSTFVALLLTVIGRPSVQGPTPFFVIRATDRAIGKSKLVQVVNLIATGAPAATMSYQDNPEEEGKSMLALGRESTPLALMDNVALPLGGDVLAMCLTSTVYKGRELGVSRMLEVPVPVLCATGVNVMVKDDLGRRVLPIDLDPPAPDWKARTFQIKNLESWVLDHRTELAHAALTILRAFHVAGCPQADLPPFASYESWTARIRQVCVWLGLKDPVLGNERIVQSSDMDRDAVFAFLETWHDRYSVVGSTITDALAHAKQRDTELLEAMLQLDPKCNPERFDSRRASSHFQRVQGRFVGGYRLESMHRTKRGLMWRVLTTNHLASPNVTPVRHLVNPFNGNHSSVNGDVVSYFPRSMVADIVPVHVPTTTHGRVTGEQITQSPASLSEASDEGYRVTDPLDSGKVGGITRVTFDGSGEASKGSGVTRERGAGGSAAPDADEWTLDPDSFFERE